MNHTGILENFEDLKAKRREDKKRPRMKQHGRALKKATLRPILHIHKIHLVRYKRKYKSS